MNYGGVGLANATNSNTDTSARIHTTGRVCLSIYNSLTDPNVVRNNKQEYRAIKEEIALGIGRPFNRMGISYCEQKGLVPVFTNAAVMNNNKADDLLRWYITFFDCRSKQERIAHAQTSCVVKGQAYFPSELFFAGIVISDGEADPIHGDNALTLMIGGKITIRNGHFPVQAGDRVHWYFEEEVEANLFDEAGLRRPRSVGSGTNTDPTNPIPADQVRVRDFTYAERAQMKRVVFVKPYLEGMDNRGATRGDLARLLGSACSNAGPYERVDIKIHRQSL
jgi:hypothetical protein